MKGMEPPYSGKYLHYKIKGIYYCANCQSALFSSTAKFESGHGWASFWDVISQENIFLKNKAVFCHQCHSHLGYIYNDGPPEKTSKRYCINSYALDFISSR